MDASDNSRRFQSFKKIGIKKGDKVLVIAGFSGDWASGLAKAGANVVYSDVSRSMVNHVRKTKPNIFGKYVCSNYEVIPKNQKAMVGHSHLRLAVQSKDCQ